MLGWQRLASFWIVLLMFDAAGAPASWGQENEPATASEWRVECANNGKVLNCRVLAEVVQQKTHQIITSLTVRYPMETKKPVMMVQVPLGVLVSEPIAIQVDNNKAEHANIQTCTQAGCFAGSPISNALIEAMRIGKHLKIIVYNVKKQSVTVTIPLTGFALAYDKIKS
jgi:invasion protein IalB